ncbi:SMP-30/gluconolactonase/LRE family protein [Aquabacterium sp. A7-Y]|uniref:SMP-30/gluconolactonase/LRE family protein n=1 Tax=Aquabacterium sp. A7-Y TaxID=1349605 RepID=UPI00223D12B1|nr:SMP-30/gluconolactonase/LRE family protein [Aquabacterium sp. A7-Y]MCW7539331.1 SMP-30/gluconolactonase/LRE family protein [Aquabacterium sp. A7-Y]
MTMVSAATPRLLGPVTTLWPAGAMLGEGTCWSPSRQALYWVDILEHRLFRYTPSTGLREQWELPDTVSAVAERRDGPGLLITLRRGFAFFDPDDGGQLELLHEPGDEPAGNRFNDGKCDAEGRFWGATMDFDAKAPTGRLYRFDAQRHCNLVFDLRFPVTNGPTWSADGRTLYFNDTARRDTYAFDFDPASGTLANRRHWHRFGKADGYPDGMTTDAQGRLWMAHWGAGCVTCHDPDSAEELLRVELPTSHITNVNFGGPAMNTLFITSARFGLSEDQRAAQPLAGALFCVETDATGVAPNRYAG